MNEITARDDMALSGAQRQRIALMRKISQEITAHTKDNFVLKGGTALLLGYNLDRYSTDLDFDGKNSGVDILKHIKSASSGLGMKVLGINTKKDTQTVQRYMIHYEEAPFDPLGIDISFRNSYGINEKEVAVIDGIRMYTIEKLAELKVQAFITRTKPRDIYDVSFLLEKYPQAITKGSLNLINTKISNFGIDSFLRILDEDKDVLVNHDKETVILKLEGNLTNLLNTPPPV
jgi:predicted nucleotidyltransferase component of viral defense system